MESIEKFEKIIGYTFKNKKLIYQALSHSSYANERKIPGGSNERLEFLGDSVLSIVVSDYLYRHLTHIAEGELTKLRASLVCEKSLYVFAKKINLGNYLMLGRGEENTGGRERPSILADAFEALIAAIYLDSGSEKAREFIHRFVLNDLEHKRLFYDAKSILQEYVQETKAGELIYELIKEEGPEHDKLFAMEARLNGKTIGYGEGKSKKTAQQHAAYDALLKKDGNKKDLRI